MQTVTTPSRSLADDDRGVMALEYALIASLMVAGLVVAMPLVGNAVTKAFSTVAATIRLAT